MVDNPVSLPLCRGACVVFFRQFYLDYYFVICLGLFACELAQCND